MLRVTQKEMPCIKHPGIIRPLPLLIPGLGVERQVLVYQRGPGGAAERRLLRPSPGQAPFPGCNATRPGKKHRSITGAPERYP